MKDHTINPHVTLTEVLDHFKAVYAPHIPPFPVDSLHENIGDKPDSIVRARNNGSVSVVTPEEGYSETDGSSHNRGGETLSEPEEEECTECDIGHRKGEMSYYYQRKCSTCGRARWREED